MLLTFWDNISVFSQLLLNMLPGFGNAVESCRHLKSIKEKTTMLKRIHSIASNHVKVNTGFYNRVCLNIVIKSFTALKISLDKR